MSEEFGPDFITVTDEDGNDFELEHLDTLEYNNEVYMAFFPAVSEDAQEGEPADIDLDDETVSREKASRMRTVLPSSFWVRSRPTSEMRFISLPFLFPLFFITPAGPRPAGRPTG